MPSTVRDAAFEKWYASLFTAPPKPDEHRGCRCGSRADLLSQSCDFASGSYAFHYKCERGHYSEVAA